MVAPLHLFNALLVGRSLHQEGKMFMAKPLVYAVGAAVAAGLAWMIFGGEGEAQAASPVCTGVDGLREPLRARVKEALADPAVTADKLEALAKAIDALTPPYACPAAAAEVRQAAKTKVIGPTPPYVPPYVPPPVHTGPTIGCAPTTQQIITLPEVRTPTQIADGITGDGSRVRELVLVNDFKGSGAEYSYRVLSPVMDMTTGEIVAHAEHYVAFDYYVHPTVAGMIAAIALKDPTGNMGVPTAGSSAGGHETYLAIDTVNYLGLKLASGYQVRLPLSWNTFLKFTGSYSGGHPVFEVERGVHHPACVGA